MPEMLKQMEALLLFFSCGVFEPFHLYERLHPTYKRQYFTSRHSSFMSFQDGAPVYFSVPALDVAKFDPTDALMTRPVVDFKVAEADEVSEDELEEKASGELEVERGSGGMGRGRRVCDVEEEFDTEVTRSNLPFLSNPPPAADHELETWRLDMLALSTDQAFAIARAMRIALRQGKVQLLSRVDFYGYRLLPGFLDQMSKSPCEGSCLVSQKPL